MLTHSSAEKVWPIVSVLALILIAPGVIGETTRYGPAWKEVCSETVCTRDLYSGPVAYLDGRVYASINTTITESSDPLFDYEVTKGIYHTYFKSDPTEGQVVKFTKDGINTTFQPMALNYRNDLNQIQQVSMVQSVSGMPEDNRFIYTDAYGSGIDLTYRYNSDNLKEGLVIGNFSDLPIPEGYIIDGGNVTLDLDFVFTTTSQHITIEGADWDKSSTVPTEDEVYIKGDSDKILYKFIKPYAYGSDGDVANLKYVFKKSGGKLYVVVKTSYSWLEGANYPIVIDPTIELQDADSENLEDTYINSSAPNTNYGSSQSLIASTGSLFTVFIKFNLSSLLNLNDLLIDSATLSLRGDASQEQDVYLYYVYNKSWSEDELTWNNNPNNNGTIIGTYTPSSSGVQWISLDATDPVENETNEGNSNVTFEIIGSSYIDGYSKEYGVSTYRPKLEIVYYTSEPNISGVDVDGLTILYENTTNLRCTGIYSTNYAGGSINFTWWKYNGSWYNIEDYDTTRTNLNLSDTAYSSYIPYSILYAGEQWKCSARAWNGSDYSSWLNSTSITVTKTITIDSPLNQTYDSSIDVNLTTNKSSDWCGYSLDGGSNVTLNNDSQTNWFIEITGLTSKTYSLYVYCNSTTGIMGSNSIWFTTDITPPILDMVSPTLDNQTNQTLTWIYINVSSNETLNTCLLDWYNGSWQNETMTVLGRYCYKNMTSLSDYSYYFRVYGNDTIGNLNVTEDRQITVDTTPPTYDNITYTSTVGEGVTNTIRVNSSDATLSVSDVTIDIDGSNRSMTYVSGNIYSYGFSKYVDIDTTVYFTIYMNDTVGNENATSQESFTVTNTPSGDTPGGGGGGPLFAIEEPLTCGSYRAIPEGGFSGYASAGDPIYPFYLQIYNGIESQVFTFSLSGNLTNYCRITEYPTEEVPVNGYARVTVLCDAPEGISTGHLEFTTTTGCEDSRPITIGEGGEFVTQLANVLVAAITGKGLDEIDFSSLVLMAVIIVIILLMVWVWVTEK